MWHEGSIVICCPNSRIKIHFDRFTGEQREQLIGSLRELLPEDCHRNWGAFVNSQPLTPRRPEKSRSTAVSCAALFFITAAVFVTFGLIQSNPWFLVIGVVCGFVGLWYSLRVFKFIPDTESK